MDDFDRAQMLELAEWEQRQARRDALPGVCTCVERQKRRERINQRRDGR